MDVVYKWAQFEELTATEFHRIAKEREAVFVVEQTCAYQEIDDLDLSAWHLSVLHQDALVAYVRVVKPGLKYEQPSIGRVMTVARYRALKIGRRMMQEAIRFTEQQYPGRGIKIGGQVYLQAFYESLGFEVVSEPYDEDGILHVDMVKPAP